MTSRRIVTLCSGGFDSICLMHYLKEMYPEDEVTALFFDYGQLAKAEELHCSEKVCEELGFDLKVITLPPFEWSNSSLFSGEKDDTPSLYLEMRNLIFVSYGISVCEALGAEELFLAFIEPLGYPDSSFYFLSKVNLISQEVGVSVVAPFHYLSKEELTFFARKYAISKDEFFSCFKTEQITGKPCPNCTVMDEIYLNLVEPYRLQDLFASRRKGYLEKMRDVMKNTPITVAKVCINDLCNMRCSYCIMEKSSFFSLNVDEWVDAICHLHELGIEHVDFFGKEPFLNRDIFDIIAEVRNRLGGKVKFSAITNGKNLLRFSSEIAEAGFSNLTLSYDGDCSRESVPVFKNLKEQVELLPPLSISYDLHSKNLHRSVEEVRHLLDQEVDSVYIKPILDYNEGESFEISQGDFLFFINELADKVDENIKYKLTVAVPPKFVKLGLMLMPEINLMNDTYRGINVSFDIFCTAGVDTVFITSEGNVYGCGDIPFSNPSYPTVNVKDVVSKENLKEIVLNKGKRSCTPIVL